jgi:nucleoid-associated protein YgaU
MESMPSPLVARTTWGEWVIPPVVDERPEKTVYARGGADQDRKTFAHASLVEREAETRRDTSMTAPELRLAARPAVSERADLPPLVAESRGADVSEDLRPVAYEDAPVREELAPDTVQLANANSAMSPGSGGGRSYVVQRGDTLVEIAERFFDESSEAHVRAILAANPDLRSDPDRILIGQELVIPDAPAFGPLARSTESVEDSAGGAVETVAAVEDFEGPHWYTVRKNDTLSRIAHRLLGDEGRWIEIKRLNGIRDAGKIFPGMRIKLPEAPIFAAGDGMPY